MKTRRLLLPLVCALGCLGWTPSLRAQATAFTYQGRLDQGANPASGSYDLQFTIYDFGSGGNVVAGPLTNSPIAVSNGLFTVLLDFGASAFNGADRWLEVGVRTNGGGAFTTLTPRQFMAATPYAVRAGNATAVAATNITGTIPLAKIPASVVTNGASGVNIAGTFSGNGAGLTNVNLVRNSGGVISSAGNFSPASTLPVGGYPLSVTAADVNGDSKLDLISADYLDNVLSVLTNQGGGKFGLRATLPVGAGATCVAAADLNGDFAVDLISANQSASTLSVLTNNGSGGFGLAATLPVGIGVRSVVVAEISGDLYPDLISANSADTLSVLTNNGSGGFGLRATLVVSGAPRWVAVGDLNGDFRTDLISANELAATLSVLTNTGSGGFVLAATLPAGSGVNQVVVADLNQDGKLDLVSANPFADSLSVFTNNGSGGFGAPATLVVGGAPYSVAVLDANGDNTLDLAAATFSYQALTILTNNGSGSFGAFGMFPVSGVFVVTGADLDADGRMDLVTANVYDNSLSVLLNSLSFQGTVSVPASGAIEFGDGIAGKEFHAGKIGYQMFTDGLDIVGAGTNAASRKVHIFSEGGLTVEGSLTVNGALSAASFNAAQLTAGTVADARLSTNVVFLTNGKLSDALLTTNVALRAGGNTFSGTQTIAAGSRLGIGTSAPGEPLQVGDTASQQDAMLCLAAGNGSGIHRAWTMGVPYGGADVSGANYDFIIEDATVAITRFLIDYSSGNVGIGTNVPQQKLHVAGNILANGSVSGTVFTPTSDRNAKENFLPVSPGRVLAKVLGLPIQQWNFKGETEASHIGPMAQDFYAAFGVGADDKHIATVDADGVALAAIQGLNEKVESGKQQLEKLEAELKRRDAENAELKRRLERLEQAVRAGR